MNINIQIKFFTEEPANSWLCFRCAVVAANAGLNVQVEAGDFNSDYYTGETYCGHVVNLGCSHTKRLVEEK